MMKIYVCAPYISGAMYMYIYIYIYTHHMIFIYGTHYLFVNGKSCLSLSVSQELYILQALRNRVCAHSLRNSGVKCVGKNVPGQFQNFSVCLGNPSAKKNCQILSRSLLYIKLAMAPAYLSILSRGMIYFFIVENTCST